MLISLNIPARSTQAEAGGYCSGVPGSPESVSKTACLRARLKIRPSAFRGLFLISAAHGAGVRGAAADVLLRRDGFTAAAVDGPSAALEDCPHLRGHFGVPGNGDGVATARLPVVCDVMNGGIILDGQISPYKTGERGLALKHHAGG